MRIMFVNPPTLESLILFSVTIQIHNICSLYRFRYRRCNDKKVPNATVVCLKHKDRVQIAPIRPLFIANDSCLKCIQVWWIGCPLFFMAWTSGLHPFLYVSWQYPTPMLNAFGPKAIWSCFHTRALRSKRLFFLFWRHVKNVIYCMQSKLILTVFTSALILFVDIHSMV